MYATAKAQNAGALADAAGYRESQGGGLNSIAGRQLEIPPQLDMLQENLAGATQAVMALESRLSTTILRGEPSLSQSGDKPRAPQSTPLGGQLQEANDGLIALRVRVEGILQRLET